MSSQQEINPDSLGRLNEVEDLATWETEERLRLDLLVMGLSIAGDIDVLAAELVVRVELPMVAGLFAGRIRSGIEERLGGLLQAPE